MQVREQLKQFVIQNFLFGRQNGLNDDDSFLENGIIDSTGVLELVQFVEEAFGIKVQDEDLVPENFDSINRVSAYVRSKLESEGRAGL
jgi:acyl carrier protein